MTQEEYRTWALEQIQEWRKLIHECPHCESCREEIKKLVNLLPPEPILVNYDEYKKRLLWLQQKGEE